MNRRELLKLGAAVPLSLSLPAVAWANTQLRMSSWLPPKHVLQKDVMLEWAREIAEASGGRLKINTLPKPVTAPPGTFDAVSAGIVDVAFNVHGYTPGRFLLTNVAEFPGSGDSAEVMSVAYQRLHEKQLAEHGEHGDLKVLAVFTNGPGHIFTTDRPVARVADLEGLRIRVGGGIANNVADALGVSAVLKPASESYELLSVGIVDGVFFPMEAVVNFKLTQIIRHGTLIPGGLYNTSWAVVMNRAAFDALAPEDQKIIEDLSGENLARRAGKAQDAFDRQALEQAREAGVAMSVADDAFMAELAQRTSPLRDAWFGKIGERGLNGAALLDAWKAEVANAA